MIISSLKAVFQAGTIQSSCEDESLLDMPADHFDGLDVKETVTELFEDVTRSESSDEVEETSKKVGVSTLISISQTDIGHFVTRLNIPC